MWNTCNINLSFLTQKFNFFWNTIQWIVFETIGDTKTLMSCVVIETCQTRVVPSMPRELPGAGYHLYLEVPQDTSKFPSNLRCASIRIPVSGVGQVGTRREERVIEPRPFKFNFKRVNNIKSFDYPARILA